MKREVQMKARSSKYLNAERTPTALTAVGLQGLYLSLGTWLGRSRSSSPFIVGMEKEAPVPSPTLSPPKHTTSSKTSIDDAEMNKLYLSPQKQQFTVYSTSLPHS